MAKAKNGSGASLGFEDVLWQAADKLRGHMDPGEYKHVVLGLLFLKYISDAFTEHYEQLTLWTADPGSDYFVSEPKVRYTVMEDRDEYVAKNVFWVPQTARWSYLQANAKQPAIGKLIDEAMESIERENPRLKGVLTKDYARPDLNKQRLGELIDLIGSIGLGDKESRSQDVLGRVYEYFLGKFAASEGKRGGEFYTPQAVVKTLVAMLEPYRGRIYDPCCGSGGMFVQSEKFVEAHGGQKYDLAIYGQESNPTTWRLCRMNLVIRGIDGNIGERNADSFHNDLHKDLRADFILANPPFNMSDWGGAALADDVRWRGYPTPPANNANYAWILHLVHHLAPWGVAGFVLANGSMSTSTSGEGEIRRKLIENDLVDCMVALPPQLFYTTQIPVCLWILAKDKQPHPSPPQLGEGSVRGQRDRRGQVLFIDARKLGVLEDRTHRTLGEEEIGRIAGTYGAWKRGEGDQGSGIGDREKDGEAGYADVAGFCKSATLEEIRGHNYVLTPGRYVVAAAVEDDGEPFEEKMERLTAKLAEQMAKSEDLQATINQNLARLGWEVER